MQMQAQTAAAAAVVMAGSAMLQTGSLLHEAMAQHCHAERAASQTTAAAAWQQC